LTPNLGLNAARAIIYGGGRKKSRATNDRAADNRDTKDWYGSLLVDYLSPSTTPSNRSRQMFLDWLGISNHEARMIVADPDNASPLDELNASHIHHGPFRLVLTSSSSDHLMYEETNKGPIIQLLKLDVIVNELVVPQLIGLTG